MAKKLGETGMTPAQLWASKPDSRPADVTGVVTGVLTGFQEDSIIAIAKGHKPGPGAVEMEYRCSIRGGIAALKTAGIPEWQGVNVNKLKSTIANTAADDKKLIKAAGVPGKSLKYAYNHIKRTVSSYGTGMQKAAWAFRGLFVIDNIKGFTAARAVVTTVGAYIPVWGWAVAAVVGAHGAISGAVAKAATDKFDRMADAGISEYAVTAERASSAKMAKSAGADDYTPMVMDVGVSDDNQSPMPFILAGVAFLAIGYVVYRSA